ncbi:hypothetical protein [Clavibacter phage 33]|nr:hypothetical protein [Clavibacter phage 33]
MARQAARPQLRGAGARYRGTAQATRINPAPPHPRIFHGLALAHAGAFYCAFVCPWAHALAAYPLGAPFPGNAMACAVSTPAPAHLRISALQPWCMRFPGAPWARGR